MEFNKKIYSKLISFIEIAKNNKNSELEARFWNNKFVIDEDIYTKVFQKLTFNKDNNGFGYNYEMKNILDVILDKRTMQNDLDTIRLSINGENDIKKYWLNNSIENLNYTFIEKEKLDKIDDMSYNIRFSLNNEIPEENMLNKNKNLLLNVNNNENKAIDKVFRLKNRYSIKTDDELFLIEMSKTKMGMGKIFKESNTLREKVKYEIEIEFIGRESKLSDEEIAKKLLSHCFNIMKIIQNSNIIITNDLMNDIKKYYKELAKVKMDEFVAADPVTIHRENLFKNDVIKNIYNRYAVTLKADGLRYFLIVYSSTNPNLNGKIYIFNKAFNFIDTGYKDLSWIGTLMEGEYIAENNEILLYDILFSKNEDVRKKHLTDIQREGKQITRLDILDNFLKSQSRVLSENFSETLSIKIKNKKYIQTVRGDGTDIFQKVKELWDARQYNTFNVDGIIFVPKYEYYPFHGGSWSSLFKWKPPILNTIDFLIKIVKDDNNKEIKYPYIDITKRLNGKDETTLKQYKSVQLFVTGQKSTYINKKNTKVKIPILFNPYNLDNQNSEKFNVAKIMIEDDGKIYANDPITNEKVEIYDDIIVEFSYNNDKEYGFKWIPFRFRKDKTSMYKNGEKVFGNGERTANDIFKAIQLPITEEMITTGEIPVLTEKNGLIKDPYYVREGEDNTYRKRFPYQNFHNLYIKSQLLYLSSPCYIKEIGSGYSGRILDLCCGRGVDYQKIKRARYAEIVGMDIDYNNIKDAQEWFKSMANPPPKGFYVRGDSSKLIWPEQASGFTEGDKMLTKKFIPAKYMFDTISLQFCFHYFYKDEITFRTILQNINDNLKIGGFVMGTTFDGERICDSLKNTDSIMGKDFSGELMWKIDKKYGSGKISFTDKRPNFGKQIDVLVKTIGVVHPEYLVNFKYMVKLMNDYGFSLVFIKPFEEFYNELIEGKNIMDHPQKDLDKYVETVKSMSDAEKRFSFFSSAFMFKKERNSSDSLFKKLVELMEKRNKLEGQDVYIVNKDTEEIIEYNEKMVK
jgi:SAM-dependent methyltransferase